jgi:predicted metal-dependent HD superfamily phosphohydrolase
MKQVVWTRILDHDLASEAWTCLDNNEDNGCTYHNAKHVIEMYNYLEKTDQPYDEALDWAVLFHDIVYDAQPDKERRSADFFMLWAHDEGLDRGIIEQASMLILATIKHLVIKDEHVKGSSAIIRADLHALTNPVSTFNNFNKLLTESKNLYNIDEQIFAVRTETVMYELYGRLLYNKSVDPAYAQFYDDVLRGVTSTIALSRIIRGQI